MRDHHPPAPPLALVVGLTGHRRVADETPLRQGLSRLLRDCTAHLASIRARCPDAFRADPPRITLLTQLAEGADQIGARVALEQGHALHAVLPFELARFEEDFSDVGRAMLHALRDRAEASWTLPCKGDAGYRLAGESMVAQADIVVAWWDGLTARGPGGTADVVSHAIRRGVPVIHLPTDGTPPCILWAGLEGAHAPHLDVATAPTHPLTGETLATVLDSLLLPPEPAEERRALRLFLAERETRVRTRPEYPLLLALLGIRGLSRHHFRADPFLETTTRDWADYHARLPDGVENAGAAPPDDPIRAAFSWSDRLADHYAQTYRSGVIANYVAAALSVLLALAGFVVPHARAWLLCGELFTVGSIIVNTHFGNTREWHRRWLDYRLLAEQLRPMRSLKLIGAARPVRDATGAGRGPQDWTLWYAMAVWRSADPPPTIAEADDIATVARHIATEELAPQIAYHRANAMRMHSLDHRLHVAGVALFSLTILNGLVTLIGHMIAHEAMEEAAPLLGVMAAALPTVGAAIFGICGQGDFAGAAHRSHDTAAQLERQAARLADPAITLPTAARVTEEAASAMIADLNEWRLSYRDRKLAIPS